MSKPRITNQELRQIVDRQLAAEEVAARRKALAGIGRVAGASTRHEVSKPPEIDTTIEVPATAPATEPRDAGQPKPTSMPAQKTELPPRHRRVNDSGSYSTESPKYQTTPLSLEPTQRNKEIDRLAREQAIDDGRDWFMGADGYPHAVESGERLDDEDVETTDKTVGSNKTDLAIVMQERPGEDLGDWTQHEIDERTLAFELSKKPPRGWYAQNQVDTDYNGAADDDRGDYVKGFSYRKHP